MANYSSGTDAGNVLGHPSYQDSFTLSVGPYARTYNLLNRVNTGTFDQDPSADNVLVAFQKLLANMDVTLTATDATVAATALKLVLRDAAGVINVGVLNATAVNLSAGNSTGVLDGGTF
jgi:hypothetical protein